MLAEPLAADSTKAASEQGDLAALGRVLYELVMHKPYNVACAWPIPESPEWARMGRAGKGWREFCNKLLSTDPADTMTLEAAQAELIKLKPKKALVPIWAVAAAALLLAIGGGVFSYFHFRPDPNFKDKWVQLVDAYPAWFRLFADENLRNKLPAEYASASDLVDKAQKQKHLELDPRDLSGKREIDDQKGSPPATRDGMNKAREAFELAKAVQAQVLSSIGAPVPDELDAKQLPDALVAKVEGYTKEYQKRGWSAPTQELERLTRTPEKENGGDYINRLLALFQQLPALKAIESDWTVVEGRQKQITDPADPILRQFPDFVRRAVYADADRDNVIPTKDIAQKLEELRTGFSKDPAFWH